MSECCFVTPRDESKLDPIKTCLYINNELAQTGLFSGAKKDTHEAQNSTWRISPEPFFVTPEMVAKIESFGPHFLKFYQAVQRLYEHSVQGRQPDWIRQYLETGKSELVLDYNRMRRFRKQVPFIIRPDILINENEEIFVSELDSIPGGFGLLSKISSIYAQLGYQIVGGANGIVEQLVKSFRGLTPNLNPVVAIIVSQESQDYFPEMISVAASLRDAGLETYAINPEEIIFQEDGLYLKVNDKVAKIDIVYRFFELFDLKNIPKIDLILYAIRKQLVTVTPPLKSYLEEKLLFALLHHPALEAYWEQNLGQDSFHVLKTILPRTWIIDPRPLPPHATIPNLYIEKKAVTSWEQLKLATKKQREYVVKVSGYSEKSWGSRGVSVGHDLSTEDWSAVLDEAQEEFVQNPSILQEFHKGKRFTLQYYDFETEQMKKMPGRVRLCPYYFVENEQVTLGGILATICPLDKKLIHGMVDSIMVPTAFLRS